MKIDTKQVLNQLNGTPFKDSQGNDLTLGEVVSAVLSTNAEGGKMKMATMAMNFYSKDEVELDKVDIGLVRNAMEKCSYFNIIVLQILETLDKKE
jgi:hypothetical protein